MTNLGLASVNFILKKIVKVTKISAHWDPHWLNDEQKRSRMRMAKQLLKKYIKYQKKNVFDILITGDETWVHFYEPKRKIDNRKWALKYAKRQVSAKQTLAAKTVLYAIFFRDSRPLMQIAVPKGRDVSGSFFIRTWAWKICEQKMRKKRPKTDLQHVHLLHDKAPAHKSSTVAQFLKFEKVTVMIVAPYLQPRPGPLRLFFFRNWNKRLSGRRYRHRSE